VTLQEPLRSPRPKKEDWHSLKSMLEKERGTLRKGEKKKEEKLNMTGETGIKFKAKGHYHITSNWKGWGGVTWAKKGGRSRWEKN